MKKHLVLAALIIAFLGTAALGQSAFTVTGTPVPMTLVTQNYGKMPKGITAYDLNICNSSRAKESVVSSEVYQALSQSNESLQPLGRQIVLASILRTQHWSKLRVLGVVLNSATGVLTALSTSKYGASGGLLAGIALGALTAQQLTMALNGSMSPDQLEKFDAQVLEPALVLDGGSCVERTVFTANLDPKVKATRLSFHIR